MSISIFGEFKDRLKGYHPPPPFADVFWSMADDVMNVDDAQAILLECRTCKQRFGVVLEEKDRARSSSWDPFADPIHSFKVPAKVMDLADVVLFRYDRGSHFEVLKDRNGHYARGTYVELNFA